MRTAGYPSAILNMVALIDCCDFFAIDLQLLPIKLLFFRGCGKVGVTPMKNIWSDKLVIDNIN